MTEWMEWVAARIVHTRCRARCRNKKCVLFPFSPFSYDTAPTNFCVRRVSLPLSVVAGAASTWLCRRASPRRRAARRCVRGSGTDSVRPPLSASVAQRPVELPHVFMAPKNLRSGRCALAVPASVVSTDLRGPRRCPLLHPVASARAGVGFVYMYTGERVRQRDAQGSVCTSLSSRQTLARPDCFVEPRDANLGSLRAHQR